MAQPPAGSSLLFGALADSGRIKQRKNGSYRMVLKGVDQIDWFTDRPDRVEGTWKPGKLLRKWDKYFANSEPNAQAAAEVEDQRVLFTFKMFKPSINTGKMIFNIKPLSDVSEDKIIGMTKRSLEGISLFVDDTTATPVNNETNTCNQTSPWRPAWYPDGRNMNLLGQQLAYIDLEGADLSGAMLGGNFESANFSGANLSGANIAGGNFRNANFDKAVMSQLKSQRYLEPRQDAFSGERALIANGASMVGASLEGADLQEARMYGVDFGKANLTGANLSKAILNKNTLSNTVLDQADLYQTDFTGTDLDGASFVDATWLSTICPDGRLNGGALNGTAPCSGNQLIPMT